MDIIEAIRKTDEFHTELDNKQPLGIPLQRYLAPPINVRELFKNGKNNSIPQKHLAYRDTSSREVEQSIQEN